MVCTLGGLTYGVLKNKSVKEKICPSCHSIQDCSTTICPDCDQIYYPDPTRIDCHATPVLYWYRVASHLQSLGLRYRESVEVANKYEKKWALIETRRGMAVNCHTYLKWVKENMELVLSPQSNNEDHITVTSKGRRITRRNRG